MKLPFKAILSKGRVLVLKVTFSNPTIEKIKFLIILNKNICEDKPIIVLITTSQVNDYKTKYKRRHHFILDKNSSPNLPKESVFDFEGGIHEYSYGELEKIYNDDTKFIEAKGCLEKCILDRIDQFVTTCRTLEKYKKKLILEE